MKIDRTQTKKSSSEVPFDCKLLIEELKSCDEEQLFAVLKRIKTWSCGKCELYHWIDVLDIFDSILEECCRKESPEQWILPVDKAENSKKRDLLLAVISFTSLLIEHSYSRHLYNSIEHLITLLSSTDMQIVLAILNLLFVFSKRSNFFQRINTDIRTSLLKRVYNLAKDWGGKEQGFSLALCCQNLPLSCYPSNALAFNYEYYTNDTVEITKSKGKECGKKSNIVRINIENINEIDKPISELMVEMVETYKIPQEEQIKIFTKLRLIKNFPKFSTRLQCVQARLNALSIIVYCNSMSMEFNASLISNALIEEIIEVLELKSSDLIEIKSASLKALTSIIHLDRDSKLKLIIDSTGANSYHGFLPILVRNCVNSLIADKIDDYPLSFVTALFSFLYHFASYDTGCEALIQCGIKESLSRVVEWKGTELDHLTFVTRAVRVIDLLTNQFIDLNFVQNNNGLNIFIQRLEYEVNICRTEQPFEIEVSADNKEKNSITEEDIESLKKVDEENSETPMEVELNEPQTPPQPVPSTSKATKSEAILQCHPQRAALLKSMLNFLKRAVQCSGFSENIRPLMYGNFPRSLRHIISNAEYYGSSLFLLATDVVSVYVYQEPSLLSVAQDNGLTDVVMYALLVKDVPPTKEVLTSLPQVFTSLCLNHRGLESFIMLRPFERLFKIFLSPDYLQAMRRRRSESIGDTATCLGNAMDELMRHQPSLRADVIRAIIRLIVKICDLGSDPKYVCTRAASKSSTVQNKETKTFNNNRNMPAPNVNNDSSSSEDEDDEDDDTTTSAEPTPANNGLIIANTPDDSNVSQKINYFPEEQIPLIDYILNVMKFLDAILSKNSTADHCQEFLNQNGLEPLFKLLQLPNLPLDFPSMQSCYAVAGVFKSLINLAHERSIFTKGLEKLKEILEKLEPIAQNVNGSFLLEDLINNINSKKMGSSNFITPLLKLLSSAHSYIILFNHICRTGQGDIRIISIDQWGSELGVEIINLLSRLYIILVWESTLLLGLNNTSQKYESVKAQIEKLNGLLKNNTDIENAVSPMEVDFDTELICSNCGRPDTIEKKNTKSFNPSKAIQQKYLKPLLTIASRLGRSLAELFALMVKLCVGTIIRRRNHHPTQYYNYVQTPTKQAINIAKHLNILLHNGLTWKPNPDINIPKFSLTFYVCSIGFTSPLLFDDKKFPYLLMLKNFVLNGGQDAFFDCLKMAFEQYSEMEEESSEASTSTTIAEQSTLNLPAETMPTEMTVVRALYGINNMESNSSQMTTAPSNINSIKNALSSYGLIEFLDSWLLLLEKMTNPTKLIDSPHGYTIPKTRDADLNNIRFDAIEYLISTYKKAFPCIMDIWNNKLYTFIRCNRAVETLLLIFSHIIKGEKMIEKNLKKSPTTVNDPSTSTAGTERNFWSENNRLDNANLQTLVEMGFPRRVAIEAIMANGDDVNAATEWILQNNILLSTGDSEEDDVLRAIRLSLNDASQRIAPLKKDDKETPGDDSKNKEEKMEIQFKLNKEELDKFTNNILSGILKLIDLAPEIIQTSSNLLISISKRNGNKWFEEMLMQLIDDIINNIVDLNNHTKFIQSSDSKSLNDWVDQLSTLPEANKLTTRTHLLLYLFKETNHICAKQLNCSTLMNYLIELLENASNLLKVVYEKQINIKTPKWIPLIILLIDTYEKIARTSSSRKRLLMETMNYKRTWRFFDERTSRWSAYQPETNKIVDDAFRNSDTECRINLNRRKYTIKFEKMIQQNDETMNARPIMLFLDEKGGSKADKSETKEKEKEKGKDDKSKEDKNKEDSKEDGKDKKKNKDKVEYEIEQQKADLQMINELSNINLLNSSQTEAILQSMITLMQLPIDSHTLDALMRLCLRLTTNYQEACSFVEKNGINALFNIDRTAVFQGFNSIAIMILRHLVEDSEALKILMDKVIRLQMTSVTTSREMHDLLRNLSPLANRNGEAFKNSAMNLLRINTPVFNTRNRLSDDERTGILLRLATMKNGEQPDNQTYETPKITKGVIGDLLNLIPLRYAEQIKRIKSKENGEKEDDQCQKLFQTHNILLFLGEVTKTYNFVAKIICEHNYPIGYNDSIMENCSALSFILDNLLAFSSGSPTDKETALYAQVLLSTIASVPFCNEIHHTLIVEIKIALSRAVCLPEIVEKHNKIQALSNLIMGIVEAQALHHKPNIPINSSPFFKLLIRKNLIADFAKVIQSLDLSSPFMPNTVNQLLKTLEYLSKTLNSQQNAYTNRSRNERTNDSSNSFSIPVIDLSTNQSANNVTIMEEDQPENLTVNSGNNQDSSINQTVSENTNAIDEQINRISNALDNSNVDENTENELFLDSVTYDYNAHPRTSTFNSDEVRTDDDDDDEQNAILDAVNDHTEMHDNVVNSNVVELSGDDTDSDDSDEDSDDVELEEEDEDDEDDAAGSTQDEEDEEDGNIDDEEEDIQNDLPFHALFDSQPENEIVLNIEEYYSGSQHDRFQHILPFRTQDDSSMRIENQVARNVVQTNHPLLNNLPDNPAANPIPYSTPMYFGSSSNLSGNYIPPLARIQRAPRHRSYRYFQGNNNWHVTHVHSRNHTTQILQRLLGSSNSHEFLTGLVRNTTGSLNRDQDAYNDDFYDPFGLGVPYSSNVSLLQSIMSRLTEESRALDGIFLHDSMLLIKSDIIKYFEKLREEELAKCSKKEPEAMDIANDYKNTENTNTTNSNIDEINGSSIEIQAHIEQLTNSVINQVLETNPNSNNTINPTNESSTNEVSAISDPRNSLDILNREGGNEPIPMTTNENSSEVEDLRVVTSNNLVQQQPVELMEQSTQEQPSESNVPTSQPSNETNVIPENQVPAIHSQPSYNLTPEERAILGDQELPEGVDPSFLAALPENIRQEVIAEQFRLQRANALIEQPQSTTTNAATNSSSGHTFAEVNPEFLAALPPNIQEEVLAQQRAEQQRVNAQNANPDTPMDPTSFFHSLPPSLRRQILADLDDSQVQLLPPEYAHEARLLRREYELRNRQIHERIFQNNSTISRIIRSGVSRRYDALNIPLTFTRFHIRSSNGENREYLGSQRSFSRSFNTRSIKGRYLLDHDALSSILILLFIQENTINVTRLHRLIKNLCFHGPTRQWIIQALLDIMEKTKDSIEQNLFSNSLLNSDDQSLKNMTQNHSWLSITLNSSFGSRSNVFIVNKVNSTSTAKKANCVYTISINRQASLFVCTNVLELLVFLARSFPDQFITFSNVSSGLQKNPSATSLNNSASSIKDVTDQPQQSSTPPVTPATPTTNYKTPPGFFDVLMRHDFIHTKKTKSKQATNSSSSLNVEIDSTKNDYSPFFQLLNLLSHHFIKKSPTLTTMLIRLMTCITTSLISENRTLVNLSSEIKDKLNEIEKTIANEKLLRMVVDVLVSKTCSEEGLVDATSLLIKLSTIFPQCRKIFYKLLLQGAKVLGEVVYVDINQLLLEMHEFLCKLKLGNTQQDGEQLEKSTKGQTSVQDRYSNTTIVINQSNVKHISGKEVQLPSMSSLISKSSNQFLLLRILKIVMHIREIHAKNPKETTPIDEIMDCDLEDNKLCTELELDHLWEKLSECLSLLSEAPDDHVVLVLQPAVESFFLVHAPEKTKPATTNSETTNLSNRSTSVNETFINEGANDGDNRQYSFLPADTQKFLIFAEKHRFVLNQILRQSTVHLAHGPFAVLVDHTRVLDFDVKRRYFRQQLERSDNTNRRDDLAVHIRREHVFEDSYRELNRRTANDWKNRFYIVFEGEEGQDAGGLLREWYTIISREIFNPNYALFTTSPGDRVTYMINSASHCNSNHLSYFKFVGRVIGKAIHDNKLLDCYFTRSFYKHILGKAVKYTDMESEDYAFYQGLVFLLEHNVNELGTELTFSLEIQEFGVTEVRDLVPNGRNIIVTEENKHDYVKLVCQEKMTGSIKKQLNSFLEGFYEIIPKSLISIFNEHELELFISGLPTIDIDDLKANTDYHKYVSHSLQIQWFWRALRSFDQADRAKFLQFVTGTSKVPLQGFSALEGMNGPQKFQIHLDDRSTDRLPSAHTCFNQLDLPLYETYDKLRLMLLKAIHECSEGFGFA